MTDSFEARCVLFDRVVDGGVIAIVRARQSQDLTRAIGALVAGGIRALEVTLTTPGALPAIAAACRSFGEDVVVGAGTVTTVPDAARSLDHGARFLVSPTTDPEVIATAHAGGALALPGAFTPSEIVAAAAAGGDAVKVFPARSLGPQFVSDVLAPLPDLRLIPTGGVSVDNAAAYLDAGAVAVGVGGGLVAEDLLSSGDWVEVTRRAAHLVAALTDSAP